PVVTSTLETGYDDQKEFENQLTFRADITPKIIPGLHISGFYTYDLSNGYRKRFQKPWTLYFPKWETANRNSQGYITDMDLTPTPRGVSSPELNEYFNKFRSEERRVGKEWKSHRTRYDEKQTKEG